MKREEEAWRQLRVAIISSSTSDTRVTPCCRCSLRLEGSRSSSRNSDVCLHVSSLYVLFVRVCTLETSLERRFCYYVYQVCPTNAFVYALRLLSTTFRREKSLLRVIKRHSTFLRWITAKRCW